MPEITLSIPEDAYKKMKEYNVKWNEVLKDAIISYIRRLEKHELEATTEELLAELGEDFMRELSEISFEEAVSAYEKIREKAIYDTSSLINAYKQRKRLTGYTNFQHYGVSDYNLAIKLSKDVLRIGKPLPAIDIIVAAMALNRDTKLQRISISQ